MSDAPAYLDPATGQTYPLDAPRWRSDSGGPLLLTPLPGLARDEIETRRRSLWRYAAALPVQVRDPVTLGEGLTPLVPYDGALAKLEYFAPTGSFKDRGASVMLSILRQQGISHVLEDSSGNGGAAVAGYAAAGGMQAKILVPASTQPAKIVQMRAYGAEVELIPGARQAASDAAERQAQAIFYASHAWQPFFLHGTKTLAYELWEDLGFRAPDNVIIPCGGGSNVLGCDIGFDELLRRGAVVRLPRLFAVQPEACAPLVACGPVTPQPTLAEGASIARPVRAHEVLAALARSGGGALAASEAEIETAHRDLARHGLYVEPTCALAAAGYRRLRASGVIAREETTVLVLTGSGLKATQRIGEMLGAL